MQFHVLCNRLGNKKKALVYIKVLVIVGLGVLQKPGRLERAGSVNQVFNMTLILLQLPDKSVDLLVVQQIDRHRLNRPVRIIPGF